MRFNQWIANINYTVPITLDMIVGYGVSEKDFLSMDRDEQKKLLLEIADYLYTGSIIEPQIGSITSLLNDY